MIWIYYTPLLLLTFTVLGHLTSQKQTEGIAVMETAPTSTIQVAFQTIAKGTRSGVRGFQQIIARNQGEWNELWQRHTADTNLPPTPAVEFEKEFVIAIFLGEKPTGGHAVEIVRIDRNNNELEIVFKELNPPPGGVVTLAVTQPFHMVRVATNGASKVSFRRNS